MLLKENVVMRTYDFTPLFRSTIGFDRLLDMLDDNRPRSGWPPYDIEKNG
jgi:molecular chaperone IbpA